MKFKNKYILYFLILFVPVLSEAQIWKKYRAEISGGIGTANIFGDLGGGEGDAQHNALDLDIESTGISVMLAYRYKLSKQTAFKINLVGAYATASDEYTLNQARSNRNAVTKVKFIEPSIQFELTLNKERYSMRYLYSNKHRFKFRRINTYVFAGIGGLIFFPTKEIEKDTDVGEQTLPVALSFPLGIGFKYNTSKINTISLELGQRYTTTDYLDGHSDKYSTANDSYIFLIISVSRKLFSQNKNFSFRRQPSF